LIATVIAPVQLGSSVVCMGRFSAVGALKAIREHKISLIFAVPSMYAALLHAVREKFQERFGVPLLEGYGLTETCGAICFNVPGAHRAGSVGKLLPSASAKFVDDDDHPVPQGQSGEIWLKGPMVMR